MDPKAIQILLKNHCYFDSWSKTIAKMDFNTRLFYCLQIASWFITGSGI